MGDSGLDIINEMATGSKKTKVSKKSNFEENDSLKADAETDKKTKITFKQKKLRKVYKGSHLPEDLAIKIEEKAREEAVSESFLIQKILEDWFDKYE